MIKVLLVDDHPMVRKGLTFVLKAHADIEVVGEANNGEEALHQVGSLQPDVVLMDLMMPVMDGIETTKRLKELYPEVAVIVLTSYSSQEHVLPAIRAGAVGYQIKDVESEELVRAIEAAYRGESLIHPQAMNQLLTHVTDQKGNVEEDVHEALTPRENEVLQKITEGKSNKEIAGELHITEKTVKTHVSNILSKLDVHDRTQAAIYAMKKGWF
ncbi:response regulator transcription factor [Mechercharimyces sp. CAU 1602]|uniref:response regulator n=1 Tax=Mechercharimyces sp. CAU 1602 TaxID=2973933 RepID=UPI002162796D|nr:response regulator transcription factor [Mechercharimyces sp. CAU 1602]MCS1351867.1 response regulator transcription factor [Mechercharimyces sp. CAU 1602]